MQGGEEETRTVATDTELNLQDLGTKFHDLVAGLPCCMWVREPRPLILKSSARH